MSKDKSFPNYQRVISANATLSTVNTTAFVHTQLNNQIETSPTTLPDATPTNNQKSSQQVKPNMKASKQKPAVDNATITAPKETQSPPETTIAKQKNPISKLSIIAIGLTLCLGGFMYWHGHQQAVAQKQTIEQLQTEISSLKQTLQQAITGDIKQHVAKAVEQQNNQFLALEKKVENQFNKQSLLEQQFMAKVDDSLKVSEQNLVNFNERLSAMSTTDNTIWLISEANYLVNLAGRKIWNDQDYTTARLLLKNADASLAQANDPSLLPARQAINKDITALAAISFTDFDGIVMTLMGLSDLVTELPLVDQYNKIDLAMTEYNDAIVDADNGQQTTESKWYDNLTKSAQSFFEKFIQIEKYDSFGECIANAGQDTQLLAKCQVHTAVATPEQSLYLRENIRLRLFIAAQAVQRHQELIYQRALNDAAIWANAYFDSNASNVKAFLTELANLQQQSINNQNVPDHLASRDELDKLMQTRVRAMLAN